MARALARSHGLDFDEVCGVDADPDNGYCDSGTCIASGYEDHDSAYARACYMSDARAAIAATQPVVTEGMVEAVDRALASRIWPPKDSDRRITAWNEAIQCARKEARACLATALGAKT